MIIPHEFIAYSYHLLDCVWNVMAHAQKPDFVFRQNGRVHLNQRGRQFSQLLAAKVCASAIVMLDTPSSELVKGTGYPLHSPVSPSLPLPCVTVCHHVSTGLYQGWKRILVDRNFMTRWWTWNICNMINDNKENGLISMEQKTHSTIWKNASVLAGIMWNSSDGSTIKCELF